MAVLRAIGYFFAVILALVGVFFFPFGLVLTLIAIIWMWAIHKGGQVSDIQKQLRLLRKIEDQNQLNEINKQIDEAKKRQNDFMPGP